MNTKALSRWLGAVAVMVALVGVTPQRSEAITWYWYGLPFYANCTFTCDPENDPGGDDYCDCFRYET